MAEKLSLELELLDKIGGPAKKAAAALRGIEQQQTKAQKTLDKFAGTWERIGTAAVKTAEKQAQARVRASTKEQAALRKITLAHLEAIKMNEKFNKQLEKQKSHGFLASFTSKLPFRSIGDYTKGAFWGHLAAEGVTRTVDGFAEGARKAVEILKEGIKFAFEAGAKRQDLELSYKYLRGQKGGKEALEDIDRFSKMTRYDDDEIAGMLRPLYNAGLNQQQARTAFAAASDLAVKLGTSPQEYIDLFSKIGLKEGVSKKQLVGMQVNVPEFYKSLAKATGTSVKAAEANAENGKVPASLLMKLVEDAIEKQQGAPLGMPTIEASKTMSARLKKLGELPEEYLKTMSQSPAWAKLQDKLGSVLEMLNPEGPKGQKVIAALFDLFNRIADFAGRALTPENVDRFTNAVAGLVGWIAKIPEYLNTAVTVAEVLAAIFVGKKIVDAISAAVAGVATVSAPMIAVAAALGAAALAFERISKTVDQLGGIAAVKRDLGEFFSTGGMMAAPSVSKGNAGYAAYEEERKRNVARAKSGGANVSVNGGVNVSVYPAKNDTNHTGQKVAEATMSYVSDGLERAAMEGG